MNEIVEFKKQYLGSLLTFASTFSPSAISFKMNTLEELATIAQEADMDPRISQIRHEQVLAEGFIKDPSKRLVLGKLSFVILDTTVTFSL